MLWYCGFFGPTRKFIFTEDQVMDLFQQLPRYEHKFEVKWDATVNNGKVSFVNRHPTIPLSETSTK